MHTPPVSRDSILRALEASNLSVAEFCRIRRLSPSTVYRWLRGQGRDTGGRAVRSPVVAPGRAGFIEVTLNEGLPAVDGASIVIEVRGGRRVEVSPGADDRLITRVVQLLEHLDDQAQVRP